VDNIILKKFRAVYYQQVFNLKDY